jgi:hypothetical protein
MELTFLLHLLHRQNKIKEAAGVLLSNNSKRTLALSQYLLERLHGMMSCCLKKREIFSSKSRQFVVINLCTESVHKNMETFFIPL